MTTFGKKNVSIMQKIMFSALLFLLLSVSCAGPRDGKGQDIPENFTLVNDVIPDALLDIRYYSTYNFIGRRIPGYEEPVAILTRRAADSLKAVASDLRKTGYLLRIYYAYRPQRAVDCFMEWAADTSDVLMKEYFYPEV